MKMRQSNRDGSVEVTKRADESQDCFHYCWRSSSMSHCYCHYSETILQGLLRDYHYRCQQRARAVLPNQRPSSAERRSRPKKGLQAGPRRYNRRIGLCGCTSCTMGAPLCISASVSDKTYKPEALAGSDRCPCWHGVDDFQLDQMRSLRPTGPGGDAALTLPGI